MLLHIWFHICREWWVLVSRPFSIHFCNCWRFHSLIAQIECVIGPMCLEFRAQDNATWKEIDVFFLHNNKSKVNSSNKCSLHSLVQPLDGDQVIFSYYFDPILGNGLKVLYLSWIHLLSFYFGVVCSLMMLRIHLNTCTNLILFMYFYVFHIFHIWFRSIWNAYKMRASLVTKYQGDETSMKYKIKCIT